jgi:AcrR family transcriptional regulator
VVNEKTGGELPRTLEILWGRSQRPTRAPAQTLSRERIVAAAIAIADGEGLAALSMAHLAERLGSATMSLYRHVANKDELHAFMLDAAPGPPPRFDLAPAGWRAALARWAVELLGVYLRHPWILQLGVRPPLDPGQLAWMDAGLRTLGATPLVPRDKLSVIVLVMHYVRGAAQLAANAPADDPAPQYGELLARLVDAERFPALAELVDAGVFEGQPDEEPDEDFRSGLDRILDGVETLIRHPAAEPETA